MQHMQYVIKTHVNVKHMWFAHQTHMKHTSLRLWIYETYVMRMWSARGWYVFHCEKMWTVREAYAKQVRDIN